MPGLMTMRNKAFENIVEKEENNGNQHLLTFPQFFNLFKDKFH